MILVGQNFGLGEITTLQDITSGAAAGATIARHVSRWLGANPPPGYGTNFQVDSFAEDQPHRVQPEYEARLRWQLNASKGAGLQNVLAMDSDQLQGRMGGMDAFTPDGQQRRRQHIRLTRHYARVFGPMLDYIEHLVEPQGANATRAAVWDYQTEAMELAQDVAPHVQHLIGGAQGYQPAYIGDFFCPDWATGPLAGHVTLTCNFQDDLVCNQALFEDRLAKVLAARDRWGVPVLVDQIWSNPENDPDGALLARAITRLAGERIGSIVWTGKTRFRDGPGSLSYLADPNNPNSATVWHGARWAAVTAAWRAANA